MESFILISVILILFKQNLLTIFNYDINFWNDSLDENLL